MNGHRARPGTSTGRMRASIFRILPLPILLLAAPFPGHSDSPVIDAGRIGDDLYGQSFPVTPALCTFTRSELNHEIPESVLHPTGTPDFFSATLRASPLADLPYLKPGPFLWLERRTEMYAWHERTRRGKNPRDAARTECELGWVGYGERRDCTGKENPRLNVRDVGPRFADSAYVKNLGGKEFQIPLWKTDLWLSASESSELKKYTNLPADDEGFFYLKEGCITKPVHGCERIRWNAIMFDESFQYTIVASINDNQLVGIRHRNVSVIPSCKITLPLNRDPISVRLISQTDSKREYRAGFRLSIPAVIELDVKYEKTSAGWRLTGASTHAMRALTADEGRNPPAGPAYRALMNAVDENDEAKIRKAIAAGANVRGGGHAPLTLAASKGWENAARILIAHGADPNDPPATNQLSPMEAAAQNGNPQMITFLLEHGALLRSSRNRETPLMLAAGSDQLYAVKILLEHGANVNDVILIDGQPMTALDTAKRKGYWEIVELLREHGARRGVDLGAQN